VKVARNYNDLRIKDYRVARDVSPQKAAELADFRSTSSTELYATLLIRRRVDSNVQEVW
jgi:hypothetical protein